MTRIDRAQEKPVTDQGLKRLTDREHDLPMSYLIDAHLAHLRAQGLSERTVGAREEILRRLHAHLPYGLAYAATSELNAWLGQDGWSRWTRATYAMHVRGFYRWATTAAGALDGDPTVDMARPRNPKCLPNPVTDDEVTDALTRSGEPWRTAILFAVCAGLRVSEMARLRRRDVTADVIRLVGKGGDPEMIDMHPVLWDHIGARSSGPLLTDRAGAPVTGKWISANARHHFNSLGMPDVHMHRFRHWYATALMDSGQSMRTVQEAMRHESVISTQVYTKVRSGQRRLAIRSLPIPTQRPAGTR